eukprot:gene41514-56156_t
MSDLDQLKQSILSEISAAADEASIEAIRVNSLGKKGSISELLKTLGAMSPDERQTRGAAINLLKAEVTAEIATRKTALKDQAINERLKRETLDVTLPVRASPAERGRIHPITQIIDEITAIFADMGFSIAEGPDIETDYYNFTALNFPEGHPAREMHDTFFLPPNEKGERKVLRTHTSPVQIRTMESQEPPIRIIIPGKTYRQDSDATHSPMFHQVEGLVIDKSANVANMRWVLEEFCKAFFEVPSVNMRFRPSFFPFTEPSVEVDIQCDRSGDVIKFGEGTVTALEGTGDDARAQVKFARHGVKWLALSTARGAVAPRALNRRKLRTRQTRGVRMWFIGIIAGLFIGALFESVPVALVLAVVGANGGV